MEMFSIPVAMFAIALILCIFLGVLIGMLVFALIIFLPEKKTKSKTK